MPKKRGKPLGPGVGRAGRAIRTARLDAGLSIDEAAWRLGVRRTRWNDWEIGRGRPSIDLLSRLCDVLGCELRVIVPEG